MFDVRLNENEIKIDWNRKDVSINLQRTWRSTNKKIGRKLVR